MRQHEIQILTADCETQDGKLIRYSAYYVNGAVEIRGPDLQRHVCHPSIQTAEAVQLEIATICPGKVKLIRTSA